MRREFLDRIADLIDDLALAGYMVSAAHVQMAADTLNPGDGGEALLAGDPWDKLTTTL